MDSGDSKEFTVQEVVERSGQSLRSFYQYFGGKHELLLALFEESVRSTAGVLRDKVDEETDPLDRLPRFVGEYYRMCSPAPQGKSTKAAPPPPTVGFSQRQRTPPPPAAPPTLLPP